MLNPLLDVYVRADYVGFNIFNVFSLILIQKSFNAKNSTYSRVFLQRFSVYFVFGIITKIILLKSTNNWCNCCKSCCREFQACKQAFCLSKSSSSASRWICRCSSGSVASSSWCLGDSEPDEEADGGSNDNSTKKYKILHETDTFLGSGTLKTRRFLYRDILWWRQLYWP